MLEKRVSPTPGRALLLLSLVGVASMALAAPAKAQPRASAIVTIDAPGGGEAVPMGQTVHIGGWAVDAGGRGTGVEGVEVYLDGEAGAGGVPVGAARYGSPRPDVAASFDRPEWRNSGFALDWVLPHRVDPGEHTLYVYARSGAGLSASSTVSFTVTAEYAHRCTLVLPCLVFLDSYAWEIDQGGPGTFLDAFSVGPPENR